MKNKLNKISKIESKTISNMIEDLYKKKESGFKNSASVKKGGYEITLNFREWCDHGDIYKDGKNIAGFDFDTTRGTCLKNLNIPNEDISLLESISIGIVEDNNDKGFKLLKKYILTDEGGNYSNIVEKYSDFYEKFIEGKNVNELFGMKLEEFSNNIIQTLGEDHGVLCGEGMYNDFLDKFSSRKEFIEELISHLDKNGDIKKYMDGGYNKFVEDFGKHRVDHVLITKTYYL